MQEGDSIILIRTQRGSLFAFLPLFSRVLLDKESPPSSFPSPRETIVIQEGDSSQLTLAHFVGHLCIEFEPVGLFFRRPIDRATRVDTRRTFSSRAHKTSVLCLAKQCLPRSSHVRQDIGGQLARSLRELLLR